MFFTLLLLTSYLVIGQTVQITGTVTSAEDGLVVPGVTVTVKGTTIGAITDANGRYSINAPSGSTTLIFSYVGMKRTEVEIAGRTVVNVTMESDILAMGEVVVLGYATRSKNELTGSTVQLSGDQLRSVPVVTVDQTLQGKVAGVNISSSSGTPGSVQDIRIRGVGSITGSNDPLIIVDGAPVVNSDFSGDGAASSTLSALSALNSNDIESLTVLKDASATAAYGARGSNGVIVITTKKGKSGKTNFDVSLSTGFQNNAVKGRTPLTGAQRKELFLEAIYNSYGTAYGFSEAEAYDFMVDNELDYGLLTEWDGGVATGVGKEGNWYDAVTNKNAPVTNASISATGGDDVSSFYASLGYNKTEATVITSDFKRITGALNYSRKLASKVKFAINTNVSNTYQNAYLEQAAYFANPNLAKYFMSPWEQPYKEDGTPDTDIWVGIFNPIYLAEHDINANDYTRALVNSSLEWDIIKDLKFRTFVSADYNLANYKQYQNRIHGDAAQEGGYAYASAERNFNTVFQNSLDYTLRFSDHNLSFKALIEYQKNKNHFLWGSGENFSTDGLTNIASAGANFDASSSFNDWNNLSYLGMANYNYRGKYIADFTFRREGSSRFAPENRFGNFWSAGVAWNASEESFIKNIELISNLRFRASYGLSGSAGVGLNAYQALLGYSADYANMGAIYPAQYGNSSLTWEKNHTLDIGTDFGILKDRITGSLAYFYKKTFDLLQDVPITRTSGHNIITQNIGVVENKGIEAQLSVAIVRKTDLNWSVNANLATVQNKVLELAKDAAGKDIEIPVYNRKTAVGQPIYAWYMRKWAGVDRANGLPKWYLNGKDGEVTNNYYDVNIKEEFQGKSAMPTYSGGFGTHVDFKGIFLDANFFFSGGNKVFEDWSRYTHHNGIYSLLYYNGVAELMDRWQEPGDITDEPKVLYSSVANNVSRPSSRFLYDGDYIRLKDIVLGYSLPSSIENRLKLSDISIFARGTNLWTWVKDKGLKWDPEVRADGLTRLTTPPVKSVVFGVNIKF
jgi:TonB-linked SusC/RagA family outer membrane protein